VNVAESRPRVNDSNASLDCKALWIAGIVPSGE